MKKILILFLALPFGILAQEKHKKTLKHDLKYMEIAKCVKKELKKRHSP